MHVFKNFFFCVHPRVISVVFIQIIVPANLRTGQTISSGKVVIQVYYFGVRVHAETQNFCEKLSCPVSAGNFLLSHTQTLPGITPPVSFIIKIKLGYPHYLNYSKVLKPLLRHTCWLQLVVNLSSTDVHLWAYV